MAIDPSFPSEFPEEASRHEESAADTDYLFEEFLEEPETVIARLRNYGRSLLEWSEDHSSLAAGTLALGITAAAMCFSKDAVSGEFREIVADTGRYVFLTMFADLPHRP